MLEGMQVPRLPYRPQEEGEEEVPIAVAAMHEKSLKASFGSNLGEQVNTIINLDIEQS